MPKVVALTHHIFSAGEWRRARMHDHPRVHLRVSMDSPASIPADVDTAADTGAQANLSQILSR